MSGCRCFLTQPLTLIQGQSIEDIIPFLSNNYYVISSCQGKIHYFAPNDPFLKKLTNMPGCRNRYIDDKGQMHILNRSLQAGAETQTFPLYSISTLHNSGLLSGNSLLTKVQQDRAFFSLIEDEQKYTFPLSSTKFQTVEYELGPILKEC